MKAVVLTRFGPPEVLQLQEVATPVPHKHDVLIRIQATTVTAGECQLRGLKVLLAFRLPLRLYMGRMRPRPVILGQELAGEITAVGGRIKQSNFNDFQVARMADAPYQVNVHFVDSDALPTGVGEPGLPPLAPAVANAWRNLTGKAVRRLPFAHGENA